MAPDARFVHVLQNDQDLARRLVRAEPIDVAELVRAVREVELLLQQHRNGLDPGLRDAAAVPPDRIEVAARLLREHATLAGSIEQLHWHLGILSRDDHGGHRQALGQYWAIFAEAMLRHLDEESVAGVTNAASLGPSDPLDRTD